MKISVACTLCASALVISSPTPGLAQEAEADATAPAWGATYELPPGDVRQLFEIDKNHARLDAPSPDGRHYLIASYQELSTIERMGRETQRLAMLELRGERNRTARLDNYGITALAIFDLETRETRPIGLPAGTFVSDMTWSPAGDRLAFLLHGPERTQVWTAGVRGGAAERWNDAAVMATLGTRSQNTTPRQSRMLQWTARGTIVTLLVQPGRGPAPTAERASGPVIRTTRDSRSPNPTYPFLLQDASEAARFVYHTRSQIAELNAGAPPRRIGAPGMYERLALSPNGRYLLTERIVEPLSPLVSYTRFARTLEVIDLQGNRLAVLRETPLRERRGGEAERDLPRQVMWLPDGSGIGYLQREPAADDADAAGDDAEQPDTEQSDDERADRIMLMRAPFAPGDVRVATASARPLSDLLFAADAGHAAVVRTEEDGKRTLIWVDLGAADSEAVALAGPYDAEDPLALPGTPLSASTGNGVLRLRQTPDGAALFLQGPGYQEDFRPRPFIDRITVDGSGAERVFEGAAAIFEAPLVALDDELSRLVVARETPTQYPQSWLWTSNEGFVQQLTDNVDPLPRVTAAARIDFEATRRDGLTFQGRISMPVGWQEGDRVPAIFWTYPREHRDEEAYRRAAIRRRNHNAFTHLSYLRWSDIWLTQGYALVYPDVPIIGDPYNDHFIQDLSDSLYAAIRKVDAMGLVDIDRIGHGGHSYGAFATANLLAHTPYFRAGIAGDGAYNRTLTPMGFQSERRLLWDSEDVYLEMSPFFQADHIDTPLLMYHGGVDNNTGTWPMQSMRMMQALTGLGKTAVLYVYPYESHGPSAIESYLDLWRRWIDWFDRYVKNPDEERSEGTTR